MRFLEYLIEKISGWLLQKRKIRLFEKISIEKMIEENINAIINNKFKEEAKRIDFVKKYFNEINNLKKDLILKYEEVIKDKIFEIKA